MVDDTIAMRQLGQAIRKRRKDLAVTQTELAALANCGTLFIIELERGKATIRMDKLLPVLLALNLQLILGEGNQGLVVE